MNRFKINHYFHQPSHSISVAVFGCGGTGSQLLNGLARIHYSLINLGHPGIHITCYDADNIDYPNIGRQLFTESEVGLNKASTVITRINRFFSTDFKSVPEMLSKDNYIPANINISCVDSIKARKEIFKIIKTKPYDGNIGYHNKYYWIDTGNTKNTGQFVFSDFVHLKNVFELFPGFKKQKDEASGPSCSLAAALNNQDLFINTLVANITCDYIWKLFTNGFLDYQGAFINVETLNIKKIPIQWKKEQKRLI